MNLKEYLLESLQSTYIFEMAYDRKHLKKIVDGLFAQIIENWCLVRYCTLYDPNNTTKNHWKKELRAHCGKIYQASLRGGNSQVKYNLISEIVIDNMELTTARKIKSVTRTKFRVENLEQRDDIFNQCAENVITLISLLSNKETDENTDKLFDYINNL